MNPFLWVIAFGAALFLVTFLPFDWWQKAPGRQRDKLIGKLLPFLNISLRNIVLRGLVIVYLLFIYLYLIIFLPALVALLMGGLILWSLHERLCLRKRDLPVPLSGVVTILLLASMFAVGLSAPLRTIPIIGYLALGRPAGNSWEMLTIGKDWIKIDGIIGLCGIIGVASWMILDAVWRLRQYRQVVNIATSKIDAVAMGLVELRGTVRRVAGGGSADPIEITYGLSDAFTPRQRIARFLLDDGTGSIIVDATTCRIRAGWIAELSAIFGVREIVLRRRKVRDEFNDSLTRTLQYGDRIYLIGNAERERGGDIVIRPASRAGWNEVLWKTLFGAIRPPRSRDIHDVFFLTDGDESVARKHILMGFRRVLLFAFIWIAASLAIIWTAQQPWRQAPPPDSWRNAFWRGPDPDPRTWVVDIDRNKRLFRFEKYLKGLSATSYDAIPALIEALTYKDNRFKEQATRKLIPMISQQKVSAGDAVPVLVENLQSRDAHVIQTTIIALGSFGPRAVPAVSALIEGLKTAAPFATYEVTPEIIRWQTARALGEIGFAAKDAIPALRVALGDNSSRVREEARIALLKIEQSYEK